MVSAVPSEGRSGIARSKHSIIWSPTKASKILTIVGFRQCQVKDWKQGVLRPHKLFCGQPLTKNEELDMTNLLPSENFAGPARLPEPDNSADIPEPDPGFERSPALERQINLLRENPDAHYFVCWTFSLLNIDMG